MGASRLGDLGRRIAKVHATGPTGGLLHSFTPLQLTPGEGTDARSRERSLIDEWLPARGQHRATEARKSSRFLARYILEPRVAASRPAGRRGDRRARRSRPA